MSLLTCTEGVVRFHTGPQGVVWMGTDDDPAKKTCSDASELFEDESLLEELGEAKVIRLLGTPENAPIVARLHELRAANAAFRHKKIVLYSPTAVPDVTDPIDVLDALWRPRDTSWLCGMFHEMTSADYSTYAMINTLGNCHGPQVPEVTKRIVTYHPAWPAFTFIDSLDEDAACVLLTEIVDPRWFRHPDHPSRFGRLHRYMGLTPDNMAVIAGDHGREGRHFNRAVLAVRTWYNRELNRNATAPENFLAAYVRKQPLAKALLLGTQRMLELVCSVWLDCVRQAHPELGFDPNRFFRDAKVARAFAKHRTEFKRV